MEMRDRERGTVFWSFGYPENIDQTHQVESKNPGFQFPEKCEKFSII